jgi:hypothetical protein
MHDPITIKGTSIPVPKETLDPVDWPALHNLGERMVHDMLTYLAPLAPWRR